MNIQKTLDLFDNSYGGDLKYVNTKNNKTHYFHLDYNDAKELISIITSWRKCYYILQQDGLHKKYCNMKKASEYLNFNHPLIIGELYDYKQRIVVVDKKVALMLLGDVIRPEKVYPREYNINISISSGYKENTSTNKPTKKESFSFNKTKPKKPRFDWNDHYLEGLRIHGNIDDAEAHADDMKRKITGRI